MRPLKPPMTEALGWTEDVKEQERPYKQQVPVTDNSSYVGEKPRGAQRHTDTQKESPKLNWRKVLWSGANCPVGKNHKARTWAAASLRSWEEGRMSKEEPKS